VRSTSVDFSIYSVVCDVQNVFYLSGARKPASGSDHLALLPVVAANETGKRFNKASKSDESCPGAAGLTINTRRRAAQAKTSNPRLADGSGESSHRANSSNLFSNNDDLYEA